MRSYKAAVAALALTLAGCGGGFFGESEGPPLPGTRIPILETNRSVTPNEALANVPVTLPEPETRPNWPQAGGSASHIGGHASLAPGFKELWRTDSAVGRRGDDRRILTPPIIVNGRVFVLDSVLNVRAYDAETGKELWAVGTAPPGEHDGFGGGLASDGVKVYVAAGHSQALALQADTGRLYWRKDLPSPARTAPTLRDGQLFITTGDNRLVALDAETGDRLWDVTGGGEGATILGGTAPAANDAAVIAALGSGELMAVRTANGRELWRNSLAALRRFDFGAKLSDIAGEPVLAGNAVYAVGAAGRTAAFSLRTGNRIWERRIGGIQTPWLAGDWMFLVSDEAELIALDRIRGLVHWVHSLPRYEEPEDKLGEYLYAGPMLAGGNLILIRSDGLLSLHDPSTGAVVREVDTGRSTLLPPVIANDTLFVLADDGTLTAFR